MCELLAIFGIVTFVVTAVVLLQIDVGRFLPAK